MDIIKKAPICCNKFMELKHQQITYSTNSTFQCNLCGCILHKDFYDLEDKDEEE